MSFEGFLSDITDEALVMFGTDGGRPLTLVYGNRTIPFYLEDEVIKQELVLGGLANNTDLIIRCRKRDFPGEPPTAQQFVMVDGERMKCLSVEAEKGDPEARLIFAAANRKK